MTEVPPRAADHTPSPADLAAYRERLVERCRRVDGVTSLAFFGSSSAADGDRRDQWSDLDFNVFFAPERAAALRADWPFLPDPERIVLGAREGDNGGVVLYADGMLFEFGAGLPWEITDPARDIAIDGGDLSYGAPPPPPDPANAIRLFLVKLYIGMGRLRRGERAAASAHVRTYALTSLAWALRLRLGAPQSSNPFDPLRRLEVALPRVAARLDELLDQDLETCGRGLLRLAREVLEPGWPEFPGRAADVVEARLGWSERPA